MKGKCWMLHFRTAYCSKSIIILLIFFKWGSIISLLQHPETFWLVPLWPNRGNINTTSKEPLCANNHQVNVSALFLCHGAQFRNAPCSLCETSEVVWKRCYFEKAKRKIICLQYLANIFFPSLFLGRLMFHWLRLFLFSQNVLESVMKIFSFIFATSGAGTTMLKLHLLFYHFD